MTAVDPEREALTFAFDEPPPAGMILDAATGLVRWEPDASAIGTHRIAVNATDPHGAQDTQSYTLRVIEASATLRVTAPAGEAAVQAGQTLRLPLAATIPGATFTVTPLPPNATMGAGEFTFAPAGAQEGVHTLTFIATLGDMRASSVVPITVTRPNRPPQIAPIPAQQVREGARLTFGVQASDPDGDALALSAPGLSLPGAVFDVFTRQFSFAPGPGQAGRHEVTFAATDGRATSTVTVPIDVAAAPPTAENLDLVVDPPGNPTFRSALTITGSVTGLTAPPRPASTPALIVGLSPASLRQGQSGEVEITGLGTSFSAQTDQVSFGDGIAVTAFTVQGATRARATITVGGQASVGLRQVTISSAGGSVPSVVGFGVEPGRAAISGTVLDPFTQQPLAGARVSINGTTLAVLTDAQGRFTLDGVPPGTARVLVTLPDHDVGQVSVFVEPNAAITLQAPVTLDALARPPRVGGTLPRSATVPSVLDRGVALKGARLTLEQAQSLVSDTLIAVGGVEAGVVDDAGNQLNPKIVGAGDLSLTAQGVQQQARALMLGEVYTVRDLHAMLVSTFSFPAPPTVGHLVEGFQRAVDEAWAAPGDPGSAMAIVLFNEGTTLDVQPPLVTLDTRFNRFQLFLLIASFLVFNQIWLDISTSQVFEAHGLDPAPLLPPQSSKAPEPAARGWLGALWQWLAGWLAPAPAEATPSNGCALADPGCKAADLQARRTFTKVWRGMVGNLIAEAFQAAKVGFVVAGLMATVTAVMIGTTGGVVGAVVGVTLTAVAAAMLGFTGTLFQKIVLGWYIALVAASLEPPPPVGNRTGKDPDGNFVIEFHRSDAEIHELSRAGTTELEKKYAYLLFRFPNCALAGDGDAELIPLEAVDVTGNPKNQAEPRTGPKKFVVPSGLLRPGENCFRIRTIQFIPNLDKPVVAGLAPHDTDQDGVLTVDEFARGGFGGELAFQTADRNGDRVIDAGEFVDRPVPTAFVPPTRVSPTPPVQAVGRVTATPGEYDALLAEAAKVLAERVDPDRALRPQTVEEIRAQLALLQDDYAKLTFPDEAFFNDNRAAVGLADDVNREVRAQAEELAKLSPEDANGRSRQIAQDIAERLYGQHLNTAPTDEQVRRVEELVRKTREVTVRSNTFKAFHGHMDELARLVNDVRTGKVSQAEVKVPVLPGIEDATGRFFPGILGADVDFEKPFSNYARPSDIEFFTFTITADDVARYDETFRTLRGLRPDDPVPPLNTKFERAVNQARQARLAMFSSTAMGGLADFELFIPPAEGRNATILTEDMIRDAIATRTGMSRAEVDARLGQALVAQKVENAAAAQANRRLAKELQSRLARQLAEQYALRPAESRLAPKLDPSRFSPAFNKGIDAGGDFLGGVLTGSWMMLEFLQNVKVLSSEFSEDCFRTVKPAVPVPTETFPASFEPHPSKGEVNAVVVGVKTSSKAGVLRRVYPGDDEHVTDGETGFPPALLSTGDGFVYAVNSASAERFGGRIFRFELTPEAGSPSDAVRPFSMTREFVGGVNFFSLTTQVARPALPVAMTLGPQFVARGEDGQDVTTRDLFVADIDIIDGKQRILRVPISVLDLLPSKFPADGIPVFVNEIALGQVVTRPTRINTRQRIVGQPVIESDLLKLTGPSDLEAGPELDVSSLVARKGPRGIIMLSDEDSLFAIVPDPEPVPPSPDVETTYSLVRVAHIPGRRFSGLAFDALGRLYIADFARGEVLVMPWPTLRNLLIAGRVIESDPGLAAETFTVARGLDRPGDIELEAVSAHPGAVLLVSTFEGIVPVTLPIVGRLDGALEVRIKVFGAERAAEVNGVTNQFAVTPSREDATALSATIRVKRVDRAGRVYWRERVIALAEHGVTVVDSAP